jgi:hypothetical protein
VQLVWDAHYVNRVPHAEDLCGSFWWRDILKLVDNFRGVASVKMGSGNTFLFWSDNWEIQESSQPMKSCFPRLFSYVLEENMSASEVYSREDITSIFYLPLSQPAFAELQELMLIM